MQKSKIKFFLSIFVFLSVGLNIALVTNYHILGKVHYKLSQLFNSSPSALSEPLANNQKPMVSYLINDSINRLTISAKEATQDIPDQLIIPPGTYSYLGDSYSLNKEGLYRTIRTDPNNVGNIQRIVYKNDLDSLLSSISWIITQGYSDIGKTDWELYYQAMIGKLRLTCGPTSQWVKYILDSLNIKSRLVKTITLNKWNGFDDGHALIEVWREKWNKWVVYDFTNNSYFKPKNGGAPFSLIEFSKIVPNDNYEIISLSFDTPFEMTKFNSGYRFYSQTVGDLWYWEETRANLRAWYRRIMQVPLIFDPSRNTFLFNDKINKNKIEQLERQSLYVNEKKFMSLFYEIS
tara:strand:- start:556 stop:1599 length:1044 start_codon:yes stop_codon:yes gene_type:complete